MKVYKFGGASVKDAASVKNVLNILKHTSQKDLLIVFSAIGKTTDSLELVIKQYLDNQSIKELLEPIQNTHINFASALFNDIKHPVFKKINAYCEELENFMVYNKSNRYDFVYDQIVCYGEILSSVILSDFLNQNGFINTWIDAREIIKTDSTYREAQVNWEETQERVLQKTNRHSVNVTQGFIGSDTNNFTTTLGREGSDYTAGIFAYCLNAESLSIWKDVPGVLNADPREFENPQLLNQVSYEEAVELAFYGASVIHPKTLQPLQRKEIPLYVRSFIHPKDKGTAVCRGERISPVTPCFIVKKDLVLISISSLDFSFMVEENISEIFRLFHIYQMKVDLIQNSAISFSVCVDNRFKQLDKLIQHLKAQYRVKYNTNVSLYTIRHFNEEAISRITNNREILLRQTTRDTVQMVTRNS